MKVAAILAADIAMDKYSIEKVQHESVNNWFSLLIINMIDHGSPSNGITLGCCNGSKKNFRCRIWWNLALCGIVHRINVLRLYIFILRLIGWRELR